MAFGSLFFFLEGSGTNCLDQSDQIATLATTCWGATIFLHSDGFWRDKMFKGYGPVADSFFHVFPGIVIKPFAERANCCNFINALGWKCVKIDGKMWGQSRRASTSKCFVFCCPSERLLQIRNPKRWYDKYLNLFKVMFHFVPTVTHHQSTSLGEYVLLFFRHQTSKSKNMAVECQGHLLGDGSVHHGWDPCLMNDWHLINDAS